jgi:ATP synthase subunit 6
VLSEGIEPSLTPWKGVVLPLDEESKPRNIKKMTNTTIALYLKNTIAQDPLEQFEIMPLSFCGGSFAFNTLALFLLANVLLMAALFASFNFNISNTYDYVLYNLYQLVRSMVKENLFIQRQQYFAILFYLFMTILLANLIGLLPYSFTITSSFVFTFFLSLLHFIGVNLIGTTRHRYFLFNLFLPSGSPLAITPFLIFIEAVSYVARVFSLSIRLFANMMSGHALLKILIGFSWALLTSGSVLLVVSVVPWVIVTAVMFLELLIAFLQAYVFTILVTLYINDVLTFHD